MLALAAGIVGRLDPGVLPGHQLDDPRCRPQIDKLGQRVSHPRQWINKIQLAGLNERRGNCPVLRAYVMAGKECILSRQCNRALILPMSGKMS